MTDIFLFFVVHGIIVALIIYHHIASKKNHGLDFGTMGDLPIIEDSSIDKEAVEEIFARLDEIESKLEGYKEEMFGNIEERLSEHTGKVEQHIFEIEEHRAEMEVYRKEMREGKLRGGKKNKGKNVGEE